MKRQQTSFSVEIKKSRTQGQRQQLPPRRLFDIASPAAETAQILPEEAVPKVAAPATVPRILPSIVEPMWSRSEPAEPVRFERSPGQTSREQMELDLGAEAEGVNDGPAEKPTHAEVSFPTTTTASVETGATSSPDVHPASEKNAKSHARKTRTKASTTIKPAQAPEPAPEAELTPYAEMIKPSMEVSSRSSERRLTKRLAAVGQLPRSERWKRRLHPASW